MKATYNAIGTVASPATLTAAYTGNTYNQVSKYFKKAHLDFSYTPKAGQTNRLAYILVEASNDGGTTYFPVSTRLDSTSSIKIYTDGAESSAGVPFVIPGDATSTGGAAYKGFVDFDFIGDRIKISVKESGSDDFGTIFIGLTLTE
jgi:hypothetical protein